jgi:hypothetical protein
MIDRTSGVGDSRSLQRQLVDARAAAARGISGNSPEQAMYPAVRSTAASATTRCLRRSIFRSVR